MSEISNDWRSVFRRYFLTTDLYGYSLVQSCYYTPIWCYSLLQTLRISSFTRLSTFHDYISKSWFTTCRFLWHWGYLLRNKNKISLMWLYIEKQKVLTLHYRQYNSGHEDNSVTHSRTKNPRQRRYDDSTWQFFTEILEIIILVRVCFHKESLERGWGRRDWRDEDHGDRGSFDTGPRIRVFRRRIGNRWLRTIKMGKTYKTELRLFGGYLFSLENLVFRGL